MSEPLLHLVTITSHDYLFYASQDYGATARPHEVIGNYALMYALNRDIPDVRRVVSGTTPHYEEDLPKMRIYATPAAPSAHFPYARSRSGNNSRWLDQQITIGYEKLAMWREGDLTSITWNSIGSSLLDVMTRDRANLPKVGKYYKFPPLRSFYFYCVGESIPSLFRLGKKYTPIRANSMQLEATLKDGKFSPTCPVNVQDLPDSTQILRGSLLTVLPAPLLLESELQGSYLEAYDQFGYPHRIPQPNTEQFVNSW
ncbi:MAG: type I-D CRISPR-associated protein Cas5/Csc1 [Candidatus Lokiarchaeota archaeon]|nr:type I-D CRISPR-associated protein Cas5/Csc1 [Candidatus Lokiarchaeota archaeon]